MAKIDYSTIAGVHFPYEAYVLVLPGWYPTWLDGYTGDFNQRHVKAAGLDTPQVVLYIGKDPVGELTSVEMRCNQLTKTIIEIIVLYPAKANKWFDTAQSNITFFILLNKFTRLIKRKWGKPLLIHSYIVMRGGLAGWWIARTWQLPLVLTENWTIYYPADPGYLLSRNVIFRRLVKMVFDRIDHFLPVTNSLAAQVHSLIKPVTFSVVPNVVDTRLFFYSKRNMIAAERFTFIHVSALGYQKNPFGLLAAFKQFQQINAECNLLLVGPFSVEVAAFAQSQNFIADTVRFTGPVDYNEVAVLLRKSNALVLFSRYENLPCVILEALCCGLPVISTDVGGVCEVINKNNGILVDNENVQGLIGALVEMYTHRHQYDVGKIAEEAAALYSFDSVGKQITRVYEKVLKRLN